MELLRHARSGIWLVTAVRLAWARVLTTAASKVNWVFVTIALAGFHAPAQAGEVFRDDFSSPDGSLIGTTADVGGTWFQTGANSTNPIQTSAGRAVITTVGQDLYAPLVSPVALRSGTDLKTSVDLNVTAAHPDGDYFLHFTNPIATTMLFYQRLFARSSPNGYQLGLVDVGGTGTAPTWGTQELAYGTSHHVDIIWHPKPGGSNNDTFTLMLDDAPYLTHIWTSSSSAEPTQIPAVNLRQGNSTTTVPTVFLDNLVVSTIAAPPAPHNIFEWQFINPGNPSEGKQQSSVIAYDGYGAQAGPGFNAANFNLAKAYLGGANLTNASFNSAILTRAALENADLTGADLTGTNLTGATLSNAILTDAIVKNAKLSSTHVTLDQLYSTASYKQHDLSGVQLIGNDLSEANFAGQNLAAASFYAAKLTDADFTNANLTNAELINADLTRANLTGANFTNALLPNANLEQAILADANFNGANLTGTNLTGANLRGARLGGVTTYVYGYVCGRPSVGGCMYYTYGVVSTQIGGGVNLAQLITTANYQAHDLRDIDLRSTNLTGANFAGFNLTNANFTGADLTGANLSGADARGTSGLSGYAATNLIRPDGHIAGLNLGVGQTLSIRDYDGSPTSEVLPILVNEQMTIASNATLRLIFDADAWDSTISFSPAIPVTLAGTLQLVLAEGVDPISQVGRNFQIFNWAGVTRTGTVTVDSPYLWDVSSLYTTGNVTFLAAGSAAVAPFEPAVPEPAAWLLLGMGLAAVWLGGRTRTNRTLMIFLAPLVLPATFTLAAAPDIQLAQIGNPTWKPVDFQLFSAPATPFDQTFGQVYDALLPYDTPLAATYVPHGPSYETELSAGALAGGYVTKSLFAPAAIDLHPYGVYFAYLMVPDPGTTGSSRDFTSGPIIPHAVFPIATNVDVWLDGVLVDRTPGADALIPVQPRDFNFQGTSHLDYLFAIWHPWDDDLSVGPLGRYDLRLSIRDVGGSGWDIVAPFRVALPGDYDYSGTVGPEDYGVWKANFGSTTNLDADGNDDHVVNAADYTIWRDNLAAASGAGATLFSPASTPAVPEPQTILLLGFGVLGPFISRRRVA